jgi:threonine/homoserine/homoserine lactone efflux protein
MLSTQFLPTAFVVVLAPGTGVIYTLAVGLGRGRAASAWAALGCTLGIMPHLLAATLGLAALLLTSVVLFNIVEFAGVAYLLYLAWSALRSGGALRVEPRTQVEPGLVVARRGALINVLNPKLSIFFLSLLTPFLSGNPETVTQETLILGGVFMAMTLAVFLVYSAFAAAARDWILRSAQVMAWLNRSFAVIFAALAGRLALERA